MPADRSRFTKLRVFIILAVLLAVATFAACGGNEGSGETPAATPSSGQADATPSAGQDTTLPFSAGATPGPDGNPTSTVEPTAASTPTVRPPLEATSAKTDREALVAFYNATSGEGWDKSGQGQTEALALPEKTGLKYPKLGSGLGQLATSVEEGLTSAESAAAQSPVHREQSVAVTIHLSGNVDEVAAFLDDHGGDSRNVGEDYIEAYVPVILLGELSEQPGVLQVREIIPPEDGGSD